MVCALRVVVVLLLAAGWLTTLAVPSPQAHRKPPSATTTTTPTSPIPFAASRLRFGIYPWAAAGTTSSVAPSVAENADKSLAAVRQLKGSRAFVVHLYADYDGVSSESADGLISQTSWWASNGLKIAAVLRYRPADSSKTAGYEAWVRTQTRRLAALSATVSIQIANEPNNMSPGTSDGSYPSVINAIATAVPAARKEVLAAGRSDILIGFSWAAGADPTVTDPMWANLKHAGGRAFTQAVGFVAVNVYPGTWSMPSSTSVPTTSQIDATMRSTLDAVRNEHMIAAGVRRAAIVLAETGYPTTPSRTHATQDTVLKAIVGAADATKAVYGITDLYWFALRDANTASNQLENGYGLLGDDYTPKPAFATLQAFVATIGAPARPPHQGPPLLGDPDRDMQRKSQPGGWRGTWPAGQTRKSTS